MDMTTHGDIVLLLTHSRDYYTVDRVAAAVAERHAEPVRLNSDLFPRRVLLTTATHGRGSSQRIEIEGRVLAGDRISAVWNRRIWAPDLDANLDPQHRQTCLRNTLAAMRGLMATLPTARWVNNPQNNDAAENKPLQLREAAAVGLRVPQTVVTNDPAVVRDLFDRVRGNMVTKMLSPLSYSMGRAETAVRTNVVTAAHLDALDSLKHCPMIFQERIDKAIELRVACVAGAFFAGAIDASRSAGGATDWRSATPDECSWRRDTIPADVAQRLDQLMKRLGLTFGAIDLVRTPEGDHVFLEINPSGEWGMLERDLDYPIADAIAGALLDGA